MHSLFLASLLLAGVQAHGFTDVHTSDRRSLLVDKDGKYDFIVVGSGPGGGPLAANLARSNFSVLLIEAGEDHGESLTQQVPAFFNNATNDPEQRWDYFVKHSSDSKVDAAYPYLTYRTKDNGYYVGKNAPAGSTPLGIYYPRAGTLGGCSTHNAMAAAMPADNDWDSIATLTNDKTWNSARFHRFLQKIEHNFYLTNGSAGHGFTGYLGTQQADPSILQQSSPQLLQILQAAASNAGEATTANSITDALRRDLNSADAVRNGASGFSGFTAHIDAQGRRVSARTYIKQTADATNPDGSKKYKLEIWTNTLVTKILFSKPEAPPAPAQSPSPDDELNSADYGVKPVALGVEYLQGKSLYSADPRFKSSNAGTKGTITAKKDVIISAGVFNTPQLLMLSGVGPAADLKKLGIPVIVDSPGVGANLQDNQEYSVVSTASQNLERPKCSPGASNDPCLNDWKQGRGPYTQGPTNAILLKTSQSNDGERDLMMWIQQDVFRGFWPQAPGAPAPYPQSAVSINMAKIHPRSTSGTVKLRSTDPRDTPEINFNFFSQGGNEDLQAMLEGVQWGRKVLSSVGAPLGPFSELHPCNAASGSCSDDAVRDLIKTETWSHHAVGTARVGPINDTMAVLDSKFNVRGVRGLRVVDASVFPNPPGAFPVLPTFLISEKAFEVILLNEKKKRRTGVRGHWCMAGSPKNGTKISLQGTENLNQNASIPLPYIISGSG